MPGLIQRNMTRLLPTSIRRHTSTQKICAPAFGDRGYAWFLKKEYDKSLADFDEAIRLDPENVRFFRGRAAVRSVLKDYDNAIADYDTALCFDPKNVDTLLRRGELRFYQRNFDKAAADYDEAIRLDPNFAPAYTWRGLVRVVQQQNDQASWWTSTKPSAWPPKAAFAHITRSGLLASMRGCWKFWDGMKSCGVSNEGVRSRRLEGSRDS